MVTRYIFHAEAQSLPWDDTDESYPAARRDTWYPFVIQFVAYHASIAPIAAMGDVSWHEMRRLWGGREDTYFCFLLDRECGGETKHGQNGWAFRLSPGRLSGQLDRSLHKYSKLATHSRHFTIKFCLISNGFGIRRSSCPGSQKLLRRRWTWSRNCIHIGERILHWTLASLNQPGEEFATIRHRSKRDFKFPSRIEILLLIVVMVARQEPESWHYHDVGAHMGCIFTINWYVHIGQRWFDTYNTGRNEWNFKH